MMAVLILIFLGLALCAAAFVVVPILRRRDDGWGRRAMLAGSAGLLVIGVGAGTYLLLGSPKLALRSLTGPSDHDLPGLVAELVGRVRSNPKDEMAWELLGRGYLSLGEPDEAAGAFRHAADLASPERAPMLLASYAEALTLANSGQVPASALPALHAALKMDPHNAPANYYLGLAYADRRQTDKAIAIWQKLADEAPANAPYKSMLIDRIATLKASEVASGQAAAPNVMAMVAKLAASLKAAPNNPGGWQRLIRAYSVLGQATKAKAALKSARIALKANPSALAAIEAEAKSLGVGS
ncbi:MAG: tetratricopeptide repeat protein [Alphaproteobacteria bacterium]|nr:tetratricopeptide repeat protein [Alphaproteobacteria bacterium]